MAFGQTNRLLNFTSPLGADVLLPERLAGTEGISELFRYQLDLLAQTSTTIDPTKIVAQKVCIGIQVNDKGTQRYINGIVSSFEMSGGDDEFNMYRATIVPNIWALTLNVNTRVFQDMTVTDIIKAVLSNYTITPGDDTSNTYPKLEYCTQYRETDFNFISRLMEQHGIIYYFKHTDQDHTFTLQDHSTKLGPCAVQSSFRYAPQGAHTEGFYDFVISEFASRTTMVPGNYTAWDYSFTTFNTSTDKEATAGPLGANKNEVYDYANSAAAYLKKIGSQTNIANHVRAYNLVRCFAGDAESPLIEGSSNAICLQSGFTADLTVHPQSALNTKYLVTHVEHKLQQLPSYRARAANPPAPYGNTFVGIPFAYPYRAPIVTRKPVVNGMHTGQVVVTSGEDSFMDKYGRVNVQFWWDRLRKPNTPDNTLLRVAQSWAGKGWGTYFWPRVGDEVLIDFIEGDPDQPIVVGSVYNGVNMPKYDPAGQYTLSGILTRSSKNGGAANANELRFEDLAGKEQVYMNAERDYDLHVEHDWHTLVGNEQHTKITLNRFDEVDGDEHFLVKGKQLGEVDGDAHLNVKGKQIVQVGGDRSETLSGNLKQSISANSNIKVGSNLNEQVGSNYSLTVGANHVISATSNFDVTANAGICLAVGPNSIVITPEGIGLNGAAGFVSLGPSGVTVSGVMVMINSGGAPVTGSPGSAQSPDSPDSPTAPTAPTWPGDSPYSQAATSSSSSAAAGSSTPEAKTSAAPASPANAATQAAQQATQQASQAAAQAASDAKTADAQTQQAAKEADQNAQQAVGQVTQQARQQYQQAAQAVQQAQAAVAQASAQGQAAAQQALGQAEQQAQQSAQQGAAAVQAAQQQAQQVQQQGAAAVQQAQQQAAQAQQAANAAAQQAQQEAKAAAQQGQQAAQQAQQAAQQAQQQAQAAAKQAQQTAQQAQQQAAQAGQQVTQAASGAQQQAAQASQAAQQSAQQAMSQAGKGF